MADEKDIVTTENQNGAEQSAEPHSKIVKKTIPQRIAAFLVSKDYKAIFGDAYKNILSPELKRMALNAITAVVRDLIYRGSGVDAPTSNGYTDYQSYSGGGSGSEMRRYKDSREITFDSRGKAEEVLSRMRMLLSKKGILTVADYYILADQAPSPTQYDFGWWKLDIASIYSYTGKGGVRVYGIRLPEPMPIDKRN